MLPFWIWPRMQNKFIYVERYLSQFHRVPITCLSWTAKQRYSISLPILIIINEYVKSMCFDQADRLTQRSRLSFVTTWHYYFVRWHKSWKKQTTSTATILDIRNEHFIPFNWCFLRVNATLILRFLTVYKFVIEVWLGTNTSWVLS